MVSTRALETAYLYEFYALLVLGGWVAFWGCFWGPKNTPLDVSVLGGLPRNRFRRNRILEPEPSEPEPAHVGTESNRTEPSASCILLLIFSNSF